MPSPLLSHGYVLKVRTSFSECNVWVDYGSELNLYNLPRESEVLQFFFRFSAQIIPSITPHDFTGLVPVSLGKGMVSFRDSDPA